MSAPTHGGRRPGAGRPHAYREPLQRVTVTLPLSYVEQLRRYGGDNISDGIRRLVEEARTPLGQFWYVLPGRARPAGPRAPAPEHPSPPAPAPSSSAPAEVAME